MRILLAPVILIVAAISFVSQWVSPADELDRQRAKRLWGWLGPEMDAHWERLAAEWSSDFRHVAKNILSEWVRLDPQRAGKVFAFLLCTSVLFNIVVAFLAWS